MFITGIDLNITVSQTYLAGSNTANTINYIDNTINFSSGYCIINTASS